MDASPTAASVIMSRLRHVDGYLLPELRLPTQRLVSLHSRLAKNHNRPNTTPHETEKAAGFSQSKILTEVGHEERILGVDRHHRKVHEVVAGPGSEIGLLASPPAARRPGTPGWEGSFGCIPDDLAAGR